MLCAWRETAKKVPLGAAELIDQPRGDVGLLNESLCHPALLRPCADLGTWHLLLALFLMMILEVFSKDNNPMILSPGLYPEFRESSSLLQTAVSVLQNSYLDSTSQDGFWYSQAILVENDVFLNEVRLLGEQGVAGSSEKGSVSYIVEPHLQLPTREPLLSSSSFPF